jgi:hypothetical protein
MLGQLPGFVAIGELGRLFDKGILDNTECGCGRPFNDCPFWQEVGRRAFGGWSAVDAEQALAMRRKLERRRGHLTQLRALPLQVRPSFSTSYRSAEDAYIALLAPIYQAVDEISGGSVIVDSMKEPWHVFALSRLKTVDLSVVHQVRDSRGVAYSNVRRVPRQGGEPGSFRGQHRPVNTGARWIWTNMSFELLSRRGVRTIVTRYEDVISAPRNQLVRVADFMGEPLSDPDLRFLHDDGVDLPPDHLVAGNRLRLHAGPLTLRNDDEWRTGLSRRDRMMVSALTWPMRRRYAIASRAS